MRDKYHIKTDKKAFLYPRDYLNIINIANERQKFNLMCMINTGARINEIRNIERKDLDVDRCSLRLRITKVRAKKGEKIPDPRTIGISTQFTKYLRMNINKYKIYTTNNYRVMLHELCKKANVQEYKNLSSHNIRKTFGTWMLALGIDGFKLAQHLGHSPDMLRTRYASPDIFNMEDKIIMNEILGDLPTRLKSR